MISRRLLRIKALQILYAYRITDDGNVRKAEKELMFSIEKSYDLYQLFLLLPLEVADYAEQRINIAKAKYFPTSEEANPNTRFIDNRLIRAFRNQPDLMRSIEIRKLGWSHEEELIKRLYRDMLDWPPYQEYMSAPINDFKHDRNFMIQLIAEFLIEHEMLQQILEEQSIFWNDDIESATIMVAKTLERCKENTVPRILSMFKDEDDQQFVIDLLRQSIVKSEENEKLIREYTQNWDFDRLALMDILIMQMAITEAVYFKNIPTKVTLNEYIDIARYYSTDKSNLFINGILDNIFSRLKEQKIIVKTGRGLIGEVTEEA